MPKKTMTDRRVCQQCKGEKMVWVRLKDLSGRQPDGLGVLHVIGCEMCDGKGYTDQSDSDRYLRGMGVLTNR